jgi:hypothetical protein
VENFEQQQETGNKQRTEYDAPKSKKVDSQNNAEKRRQRMYIGLLVQKNHAKNIVEIGHDTGAPQNKQDALQEMTAN